MIFGVAEIVAFISRRSLRAAIPSSRDTAVSVRLRPAGLDGRRQI
jgi:hypothetical protein